MPVLQLDDRHFPLAAGPTRLGAEGDADVAIPGAAGVQAIVEGRPDGYVVRRGAGDVAVRVNGVALGLEPVPLMHGDRIEVGTSELRFADDAKGGATQFVSADDIAAMTGAKRTGAARATTASGGRLVSLVDGKEYGVPAGGLVVGRDASCDVVVAQSEVSRRHAEIAADEQGYLVRDTSANGVFVNGERVQGSHRLARADVLRLGTEEFRFYADVLAPTPAAPVASVAADPVPAAADVPPPPPPADVPLPAAEELDVRGTRAMQAVPGLARHAAAPAQAPVPHAPEPSASTTPVARGGMPGLVWVVVLLAVASAAYFLLMGRA